MTNKTIDHPLNNKKNHLQCHALRACAGAYSVRACARENTSKHWGYKNFFIYFLFKLRAASTDAAS